MKKIATLMLAACCAMSAQANNWDQPQQPFAIYGNTYYVGTAGISAVLITSPQGHILIDGATEQGGKVVADNIRTLGFRLEDVKSILSSHAHDDHAGGLAQLQKLTGAPVLAGAGNVPTLRRGVVPQEDPQFGTLHDFPAVPIVHEVADGATIRAGSLAVVAHATPGHTPGGTSYSWQACEAGRCMIVVFGDSLSAISADGYRFSEHPALVDTFRASFAKVAAMPCDVLITTHPESNDLFERLARQPKEGSMAFVDRNACRAVAAGAAKRLDARLSKEAAR